MNNEKRKVLRSALSHIQLASDMTKSVLSQETDDLNNMPENLEGSQTYEKMEQAVELLEDALDSLEEASSQIQDAI